MLRAHLARARPLPKTKGPRARRPGGCRGMEDASWHRVETLVAPEGEGWPLEEDTSELIVLDLSQTANTSHVDLTLAPGTDVTLSVCIAVGGAY